MRRSTLLHANKTTKKCIQFLIEDIKKSMQDGEETKVPIYGDEISLLLFNTVIQKQAP